MTSPSELIDDLRILEPPDPWLLYYWIGGGLLGLLLLFLLVRLCRAWRQRRGMSGAHDSRAAQAEALAALEELSSMVDERLGKPYAIESSKILRQYFERRFDIRAPVQSTEEFLHEMQHSPLLNEENQELLELYMNSCDYLKFARGVALREELEDMHAIAVHLVKETRSGSDGGHV
jgi:hypothetical protein